MPRRIEEDHKDFIDVVSGRLRKALKKFIKSGTIVRSRGSRGKISITIPKIDIPQILYGDNGTGTGRGQGKDGDVIDKGKKDKGKGNGAGQDAMLDIPPLCHAALLQPGIQGREARKARQRLP